MLHAENAMPPGEFQFLLGSAAAGGLVIVGAGDLVTLLVGLELLTLPSIALVGLRQADRRAIAASWTFFLTSMVATAITLMGIALLYGVMGSLRYGFMGSDVVGHARVAVTVAILLTLTGFLFKLGTVPFHAWVPDAYRSASPVVAGFLASVSKAATLGALLVLLYVGLPEQHAHVWQPVIALVAAVTMTIGNLGALRQRDGVAVLAWSSIAQAGFLLAPAVGVDALASVNASAQYLAVYALANIVAFVGLAVVLKLRGSTSYGDLTGLARTDPWIGVPLAFAVLTLAGFPPAVIGLVTKYVVFVPVVQDGPLWLAIVMAINVMIGLVYYLGLVATLFAPSRGDPVPQLQRVCGRAVGDARRRHRSDRAGGGQRLALSWCSTTSRRSPSTPAEVGTSRLRGTVSGSSRTGRRSRGRRPSPAPGRPAGRRGSSTRRAARHPGSAP